MPFLRKFDTAIIVNACGSSIEEYVELCKILNTLDIDGVELNLSCPNVKAGCLAFGNTYEGVKEVTSQVRKVLDKPLIVKLTPNVTNIAEIAKAVEELFGVKVAKVNTISVRGKFRRQGWKGGYTAAMKKAIVTLTAESKGIEFFDGMF